MEAAYEYLASEEAELLLWGLMVRGMGVVYLLAGWGIFNQVRAQPLGRGI